jgi:hypothetical protein
MDPQKILEQAQELIKQYANGDGDKWFYANRFVFARLALDEKKTKTKIKKALLNSGAKCHLCGKEFESKKNVNIHRIDDDRGYTEGNCSLMHPECHVKHHAEVARRTYKEQSGNVLRKESKLYTGAFLYWWDITPNMGEKIEQYDMIEFIQKDSGYACQIPVAAIKGFLTEGRKTSRGTGNWGIRVLREKPNELAFEPGDSKDGKWFFLPVVWIDERRLATTDK